MSRSTGITGSALVAALAVGGMLSLAGCSAGDLPEFQREQTEADRVTAEADDMAIDMDSSRFVGEAGQYGIYLARPSDAPGLCLVAVVTSDDEWISTGCGGSDGVAITLPDGTTIGAGSLAAEGTHLSESVVVAVGG